MRYQRVNVCGICKHCTELVPTRTLRTKEKRATEAEIAAQLEDKAESEAEDEANRREYRMLYPRLCGVRA